jgi:plastocyanin
VKLRLVLVLGLLGLVAATMPCQADTKAFQLVIKDHVFTPDSIVIPAYQKVRLIIHNQDDVAEEFDSFDLNREKAIFANRRATLFIGPLAPGEYSFFGEFHPVSARGVIIVEAEADVD